MRKLTARTYERYQRNPDTRKRYGSSWRKARKEYLDEHHFCELCRRDGKMTPATLVHHIKAAGEGGTNEEENLMSLFTSCHSHLHAQCEDRWHTR